MQRHETHDEIFTMTRSAEWPSDKSWGELSWCPNQSRKSENATAPVFPVCQSEIPQQPLKNIILPQFFKRWERITLKTICANHVIIRSLPYLMSNRFIPNISCEIHWLLTLNYGTFSRDTRCFFTPIIRENNYRAASQDEPSKAGRVPFF